MADKYSDMSNDEMMQEAYNQAIKDYEKEMLSDPNLTSPNPVERENQYKFMKHLTEVCDTTRIANLTSEELGNSELSVRGLQKTALLCNTLGIPELAECYMAESQILTSSSMSRYTKGVNLLTLIFTQIRKHVAGTEQRPEKKKGIFNFGDKREQ